MSALPDPDAFARETLRLLGPAPADWVPPHAGIDHNVVIVGGGQGGCAHAHALRRAGIGRVSVIDAAPDASQAGVWLTRARMHKLRTPKGLVGTELGMTALGFQAWHEARQGRDAYAALDRIPRLLWAEYLAWFRNFLDIPVRYGTRLVGIEPLSGVPVPALRLKLMVDGRLRSETTRKLVLCNGVAGNGAPIVPECLKDAIGQGLAAHTADAIDFRALAGKTVAVIGSAASAFDAAAVALESGAAAVHLCARRAHLAARAVAKPRGYAGFYDNFHALPDANRWHHAVRHRRAGTTPPPDSLQRVLAHANFHLHLQSPWQAAIVRDGRVHTLLHGQPFEFDFVIAGTGYSADPADRPELGSIAHFIARWRDRFTPPPDERDDALGATPYLGTALEYTEKTPGSATWLGAIHVFNPAGFASSGGPLGDVPSMRRDIPAIVRRISQDLMLADLGRHEEQVRIEVEPDFTPETYAAAVWRRVSPA